MENFNVHLGSGHLSSPNVPGKYSINKVDPNGLMIVAFCREFDFLVKKTIFSTLKPPRVVLGQVITVGLIILLFVVMTDRTVT